MRRRDSHPNDHSLVIPDCFLHGQHAGYPYHTGVSIYTVVSRLNALPMQASGRLPKESANSVSEQRSTDGGKRRQGEIYWKGETIDRIDMHISDKSSLDFETKSIAAGSHLCFNKPRYSRLNRFKQLSTVFVQCIVQQVLGNSVFKGLLWWPPGPIITSGTLYFQNVKS